MPKKPASPLPESLERNLTKYMIAGAGALLCANSGEASIVYSGPQSLPVGFSNLDTTFSNSPSVNFTLYKSGFYGSTSQSVGLYLALGVNTLVKGTFFASNLPFGDLIGPGNTFNAFPSPLARARASFYASSYSNRNLIGYTYSGSPSYSTTFARNTLFSSANSYGGYGPSYIGFKYTIGSDDYYGWALVNISTATGVDPAYANITASLEGWAFESCAGVGIAAGATEGGADCSPSSSAPEPGSASLLTLAGGALTLAAWRRRKKKAE
jgi:MYXO-CTERM domain-containing protein